MFQCIPGAEWGEQEGIGPTACMEPTSPEVPYHAPRRVICAA